MPRHFVIALLLFSLAGLCRGESDFERELKQLLDQRDKARAAAVAPIDAKFKVAAEQLLRRATQLGDLDSANKIKGALDGNVPLEAAKTTSNLKKQLVGTKWKADGHPRPGLPESFTFQEKTIEPSDHPYEVDAKDTITITFPKGAHQSMALKDGKRIEFTWANKPFAYDLVPQ